MNQIEKYALLGRVNKKDVDGILCVDQKTLRGYGAYYDPEGNEIIVSVQIIQNRQSGFRGTTFLTLQPDGGKRKPFQASYFDRQDENLTNRYLSEKNRKDWVELEKINETE